MGMTLLGKGDKEIINVISGSVKSMKKISQGDELENETVWLPASKMIQ